MVNMDTAVKTVYDPELNAHVATITPPYAAVQITVHIDEYESISGIDELFLYNFDVDSNCIEFAFGERVEHVEEKRSVTYNTDPNVHVPPFRIQISHQLDTARLDKYAFTVSYQLLY
jgi:hypothetical protein